MSSRDVVLTGIPRSGTTLACTLLNRLPNTVALNEPMDTGRVRGLGGERERLDWIDRFYSATRASLLADGTAASKQAGGVIVDNNFGIARNGAGARTEQVRLGTATIETKLDHDFLLCAKHPGLYTALLDRLASEYRCYALVRNPLAVLASWNAVEIQAGHGRSAAAEAVDPELARDLGSLDDNGARQIRLLSWFFERYRDTLPAEAIIRYEDVIASGGAALSVISEAAVDLNEPLESRNESELYDREFVRAIGERLLRSDGAYWDFYSRESVEGLI